MWHQGTIGEYTYYVKVYETSSMFGIDGGKISKMQVVKDGQVVINYDRGWDIQPYTEEEKDIFSRLFAKFN